MIKPDCLENTLRAVGLLFGGDQKRAPTETAGAVEAGWSYFASSNLPGPALRKRASRPFFWISRMMGDN